MILIFQHAIYTILAEHDILKVILPFSHNIQSFIDIGRIENEYLLDSQLRKDVSDLIAIGDGQEQKPDIKFSSVLGRYDLFQLLRAQNNHFTEVIFNAHMVVLKIISILLNKEGIAGCVPNLV
jgi:hypothetical protein